MNPREFLNRGSALGVPSLLLNFGTLTMIADEHPGLILSRSHPKKN